jgi:hypothetical protein
LLLAVAVAVSLAIPTGPVSAEPSSDADRAAAGQAFEEGVKSFDAADYEAALEAFERAYALEPHYGLLYNIGVTQLKLGRTLEAHRSLRMYLSEGGDAIGAARRRTVEQRLQELATQVGSIRLEGGPAGASVRIDGRDAGTLPLEDPLDVLVGARRVEVSAEGFEDWDTQVDVEPGEPSVVRVELAAVSTESAEGQGVATPPTPASPPPLAHPTQPAPHPVDDVPPPEPVDRRLRIATWSMLGLTLASGIGTAVTGGLAVRADNDLNRELDRFPADPGAVDDARNRRRTLSQITDALIGVTAVLGAATVALGLATGLRKRNRRRVTATAGGVRVRF